jgi:pyruvate dehydrogenase E1 component
VNAAGGAPPSTAADLTALREVERRLLWLSSMTIHHANQVRINDSDVKVGGHQASSSSLVSVMTALWFHALRAEDRVSVKPTASPVLYSIGYLLGMLDKIDMETLRSLGGLQAYPSRRKQPGLVDYSTGSMGLGATATLWDALVRRYLDDHFTPAGTR